MALSRGTRLGPYQILAPIGAGGMGEVYRATDTRLERTVAIKVLPAHVASDPERKARFEREAKTVAALSHPHICPVFDVGREGETDFLVMEYLEGETLADRLSKGALPLDQALRYAIEIADALDKAHRQGVTHRDLKPANIMLTKAGAKLLDFGLAKLKPTGPQSDASTKLADSLTQQGTILGTFQYMSPEQLNGEEADARTDIFAFGAVLYEMTTGRKAFEAKTQASLIAAILERVPPAMSSVEPMTPAGLDYIAKTCLGKDPDDRWQTARDLLRELKRVEAGGATPAESAATIVPQHLALWQRPVPAAMAALLLVAVTGLTAWNLMRPAPPSVARFVVNTPPDGPLRVTVTFRDVALAPDGTRIVYQSGTSRATSQLYVRHLDQLEATLLRGTEGGMTPFFSPGGAWVGFTDLERNLKRVSVLGGPPVTIADVRPTPRGLSWGPDDTIVFATAASAGLLRVPAVGGEPEQLTTVDPDQGETNHWWPDVLPNGKGVLFTAWSGTDEGSRLAVVSLETREVTYLLPGGSHPQYSPTGHIVYGVGGTLRAVGFDANSLTLTSDNPVPVLDNVNTKATGAANFSLSDTGSLVYVRGEGGVGTLRTLVWVDREGREEPVGLPPDAYQYARLSPDGTRIAVHIADLQNNDIWVSELARGTLTRLTTDAAGDFGPLWTPDGESIVFTSQRETPRGLFSRAFDGTGPVERLMTLDEDGFLDAGDWSPDGQSLIFWYVSRDTRANIGILSLEGEPSWEPLIQTEARELQPAISPDGGWIAYTSEQTGQPEVYVQRFPELGQRQQISTGGGSKPRWSPDGRELFYANGNTLMVVPIETEPSFRPGTPDTVFEGSDSLETLGLGFSDISPDGQRFLIVQSGAQTDEGSAATAQIVLTENWFSELERLVPTP